MPYSGYFRFIQVYLLSLQITILRFSPAINKFLAFGFVTKHNYVRRYIRNIKLGDAKMNPEQNENKNLIDTTDCLEAVSVFRGWKNTLFVIVILCMLLLQASFWLVDTGYVKVEKPCGEKSSADAVVQEQAGEVAAETKEKIEKAAEEAVAPTESVEATPQQPESEPVKAGFRIEFNHLARLVRFVNFVLVPFAVLYCLTMLFALKISLVGRLGGINHISRAFFISLAFVIFLLPWQRFFGGVVFGAMYTLWELAKWYNNEATGDVLDVVFYYFRFAGYWLIVLLLLIFSFIRSGRWAKTILRRLEVV